MGEKPQNLLNGDRRAEEFFMPMFCLTNETKMNAAKKFLSAGNKVKVSVRYRGRELAHPELGKGLLERFKDGCSEVGSMDKPPKMEGRSLAMFLAPKPTK